MIFNAGDYAQLWSLFYSAPPYAGYRPNVAEAPNGDGRVDAEKRFLHVALKYDPPAWAVRLLARAHFEACIIAEQYRVPDAFYPRVENGTLRVLEYPPGATSVEHTDFDLFTVNCWRAGGPVEWRTGTRGDWMRFETDVHMGEIGELVGLGPATAHRVPPMQTGPQGSIVYFAMPAMDAVLPSGETVRAWLDERLARSRVYV